MEARPMCIAWIEGFEVNLHNIESVDISCWLAVETTWNQPTKPLGSWYDSSFAVVQMRKMCLGSSKKQCCFVNQQQGRDQHSLTLHIKPARCAVNIFENCERRTLSYRTCWHFCWRLQLSKVGRNNNSKYQVDHQQDA